MSPAHPGDRRGDALGSAGAGGRGFSRGRGFVVFVVAALAVLASGRPTWASDDFDSLSSRWRAALASPRVDDRLEALKAMRASDDPRTIGLLLGASETLSTERDRANAARKKAQEEFEEATAAKEKERKAFARAGSATSAQITRHAQRMEELEERIRIATMAVRIEGSRVARVRGELDGVRAAVARVLARLPPEEAERAIATLETAWLRSGTADPEDRVRFVDALDRLEHPAAGAAIRALAVDPKADPRARVVALLSRAQRRDPGALDDAIAALSDASWAVQAAAIEALRELHEMGGIEPLILLLGREDLGRLREDAQHALWSLTGERHGPYRQPWEDWWVVVRPTFVMPKTPTSVPALVQPEKGVTFYGITTFSKRIVFVVDVSASMNDVDRRPGHGAASRKVEVARKELGLAIDALDDTGRFDVLLFDQGVAAWQAGLVRSDKDAKQRAKAWVAAREPQGTTNLHDALQEAFTLSSGAEDGKASLLGADTMFFLTDGRATAGGVEDDEGILAAVKRWSRTARATVHCVGLGSDHAADLLAAIAAMTGGRYVAR